MGGGKTSKVLEISQLNGLDLFTLFDLTNRIRDKFKGNEVNLCAKGRAGFYSDGARSGFHPDKLFKPDQGHKNGGGKSFNPHGMSQDHSGLQVYSSEAGYFHLRGKRNQSERFAAPDVYGRSKWDHGRKLLHHMRPPC